MGTSTEEQRSEQMTKQYSLSGYRLLYTLFVLVHPCRSTGLVDVCVSELRRQERLFMGISWKPFSDSQPRNAAVSNHAVNGDVTGRGIWQSITG